MSSPYLVIGSESASEEEHGRLEHAPALDPGLDVWRTREFLAGPSPGDDVEGEGDVAELALRPLAARAEEGE
eukprot:392629-Alexandrium_andersonii.AAC.1